MNSEQQRERSKELVTAIKSVLPDSYLTWIERVDPDCEQVYVRLTLNVTIPMPDKEVTSLDGDVGRYGRVVGDEIRRHMNEEIRNVLRQNHDY